MRGKVFEFTENDKAVRVPAKCLVYSGELCCYCCLRAVAAANVLIVTVVVLLLPLMPLPICFDFNPAYSPTMLIALSFARL